ncbi:bifunctional lysylphosphatidylglycerol flippase/synthetase MprF [Celeribacter sp. HF31]|uniref:bifunctional lysylphosphatidylglycerol flippase/synthetase MprF n=1 Tax=Celeribacter sp. HF31 TaxID=2721558 RepID=UPI0014303A1A|nr:bifunctional lysylphosphatidylglycerol flippase/synthetase MprF [Celeribacter sp. HF31]NIY79921.1 bifunctional lysylphosphatidylglycerol flippase/synthetase MprF [Celeribacter sp. HF31]
MSEMKSRIRLLTPYLITAALFAAGSYALYHLLRDVQLHDVMAMVRATPLTTLWLALLCTFIGYVALIGYDWSALRYIGHRLPFHVTALGSFLGYGIGNTVGAGPITGGAVRYRIYSALGLSPLDIAGISFFGSVSFGLGSTVIGLLALAWHPDALGSMILWAPSLVRWSALSVVGVVITSLAIVTLQKKTVTVRGVTLAAPSLGLASGQFVFVTLETIMAASTLYLLLPSDNVSFASFLAIYAIAVMAGVLSHVPGGVGVFETIIIAALPADVPVTEIAAGLLLFRLIYYLVPFALALILMALGEARLLRQRLGPTLAPTQKAISALMPLAMSAMVFASGVLMMLRSLLPTASEWTEELEVLLPLGFVEGGALLSSALGACLLVIAHGLLQRVEGAWWLAMGALLAGAGVSVAHGLDYDRAVILLAAALVLLPARHEFYRATRLTHNILSLRWVLLIGCLSGALAGVFFFAHKAVPYETSLWWQFASDHAAPRSMRAGLVGLVVMVLLLMRYALRPSRLGDLLPDPETLDHVETIVHSQDRPEACVALTGDKAFLFSDTGNSFLMYRIQGRSWIALHDPIGKPEEFQALVWDFHDAAYAANARPVFYAVSAASATIWIDMGMVAHKFGEEAVVDLNEFSLEGASRKRLRTAYNRALRDGLGFEVLSAPHGDNLLSELKDISDGWLKAKVGEEKGFSVGSFDTRYLNRTPIAVVRHEGKIVAFANLWVTDRKHRASLDLMRHRDSIPNGTMDFLFTSLLLHFKDDGHAEFSLGNAPLSGLEARRGVRMSTHLGAFVYRHGGQFYNFEGLRGFKQKFSPRWEPVYIVVPPRANIMAVAHDLIGVIG